MSREGCYQMLANAVIIQAAKDYRRILRCLSLDAGNKKLAAEKKSIETFFCSEWYLCLTTFDSGTLIRRLREEVVL